MLALNHWLVPKVSIGLTTFALTQFSLLANYQSAIASPQNWQSAENAPRGLMQQLAKEKLSQSQVNPQKIGIMKIIGQNYPLYVIDPRNDSLCGAAGCAYFGYVPRSGGYQQVFEIYLNPNLPPNVPLIEAGSKLSNGLPCLDFSHLASDRLEVVRWCYNGQKYRPVP